MRVRVPSPVLMVWTTGRDLPPDWHARKAVTFARYGSVCHVCGHRGATEVDHVKAGDDHGTGNLRPIHTTCHKTKTAREALAGRKLRRRPTEQHPGIT